MSGVLVGVAVIPLVATVLGGIAGIRLGKAVTIFGGVATFGLSVALVPSVAEGRVIHAGSYLRVDPLSAVFLLAVAFVYATTAIFSAGYLGVKSDLRGRRYARLYHAGINLFAFAMVMATIVNGLALLWVAVEVTTVVSALLVAIDDTELASEAAWKYVLVASLGLGIALFGTIVIYYAGTTVFGASYSLSFSHLESAARRYPHDVVRLAFVLAVLGYGTKVGLFPVHTWLPDAHSEAPTPVSAMLSASLLAVAFYAILRFYQVTVASVGSSFPRDVLLGFGIASLALAALYLLAQRDLKRLLAYSSIEHMGIIAIGVSFGVPLALFGVLLHVLAHAAAKSSAFFGAGSILRGLSTKALARIRGGAHYLPFTAPLFVAAVLGLSGLPPFGIFRSEFLIVAGGLESSHDAPVAVLVALVIIAFFGLAWYGTETMLTPPRAPVATGPEEPGVVPETGDVGPSDQSRENENGDPTRQVALSATALARPRTTDQAATSGATSDRAGVDHPTPDRPAGDTAVGLLDREQAASSESGYATGKEQSVLMVVAMVLGLSGLLLLGLHLPASLSELLNRAVTELGPRGIRR